MKFDYYQIKQIVFLSLLSAGLKLTKELPSKIILNSVKCFATKKKEQEKWELAFLGCQKLIFENNSR